MTLRSYSVLDILLPSIIIIILEQLERLCSDWIGLDLFNDDTRPTEHTSRPTQVGSLTVYTFDNSYQIEESGFS